LVVLESVLVSWFPPWLGWSAGYFCRDELRLSEAFEKYLDVYAEPNADESSA